MTSDPKKPSVLSFFLWAVVLYAVGTAVQGYWVGRQISAAKSNPFVSIGSQLIGRDATERYAIQTTHTPAFVTVSPTFWIALRLAE